VSVDSPSELRRVAEDRWQHLPEDVMLDEEQEVYAFEETHDLARGLQGCFLPSVWMVREGGVFTLESERSGLDRLPAANVMDALERLGDHIAERIAALVDERSRIASDQWQARERTDRWKLAQIATGLPEGQLRSFVGGTPLDSALDLVPSQPFEITEMIGILAATRGALPAERLREIVARVRNCSRRGTQRLDALAAEVDRMNGEWASLRPYQQGHRLANWLRSQSDVVAASGRVDPEALLSQWNVTTEDANFGDPSFDAVACWGPRYGPIILVNQHEKHIEVSGARRATLAHEICHLLVDRQGALPLAEVLRGNVPRFAEQRANAFAAEFLLPRLDTQSFVEQHSDLNVAVRELTKRFGVSDELCAWQVYQSGVPLNDVQIRQLRDMVSNPDAMYFR
jgi:hypothetical protein